MIFFAALEFESAPLKSLQCSLSSWLRLLPLTAAYVFCHPLVLSATLSECGRTELR